MLKREMLWQLFTAPGISRLKASADLSCMKSLPPPLLPTGADPPAGQQFSALLRHGRYSFTERELMEHLQMTYRTIKQREADPSGLTLAEALRVADLLAVPVQTVLAAALADVEAARRA